MALRWGIAGSGRISHDFVSSIKSLPKTDHQVVAVGARSLASAEKFAKEHDIPKAYEGYLKIAQDADIDVVYVGNLNPQHFEVSKLMLEHGKHVLCEKPLTLNEKQTAKLIEIAKNKKLFLMEAIWTRLFPVYFELRKILESGSLGEILQVSASFGASIQNVDRVKSKEMGGGTILDLGVYCLQFQQLVFKSETPTNVFAVGGLNENGIDQYTTSIWTYSGNKVAVLNTSAKAPYTNEAVIVGTKGILKIPQFWCPTELIVDGKLRKFELPKTSATFNFSNSVGLSYEAEHVRQCIKGGKLESPFVTHADTLQLARHMDILRKQVGVVFDEDKD